MTDEENIRRRIMELKVGETIRIDRCLINDLPDNMFTGEGAWSRILSGVVGAAWGFRYDHNPETGDIAVTRIEPDGRRRSVDHDRLHLFDKRADGTYVRNDVKF